jgi:signal peptidase II
MRFVIELLFSGGLLLFLDQWSKRLVDTRVCGRTLAVGRLLLIRPVANRKSLYSRGRMRLALTLMWLGAFGSAIVLSTVSGWVRNDIAIIALGSACGGAAGNLLDILVRRQVRDFIDLRWWPVFNLADVAITSGVLLALWMRT